jgi:homoserine dehydrogenase
LPTARSRDAVGFSFRPNEKKDNDMTNTNILEFGEHDAQTPVELVIAGATGNVGRALVRQLRELEPRGVRLRILANSRFTNDSRACSAVETDWPSTLSTVEAGSLFVDCTASTDVASLYERLLYTGIGVVTANKIAGSGDADHWRRLRRVADRRALPLRYETTAGAALPILRTARELAATGDRLLALEAVLSGTISYLLGRLHDGIDFSAAVAEAKARGFTEPDPLIDLTGRDVAAKLVIVLRELGIDIDLGDVRVEPLAVNADEISSEDSLWRARAEHAATRNRRLVFVASYVDGVATARVREIDRDDPLARLRAGENIVIFRTQRYDAVPLTIAGPGAGPEVTAAGILAEVLDSLRYINAHASSKASRGLRGWSVVESP